MNFDDFEQRLARTPVPGPPAELRREILEAIHRERSALDHRAAGIGASSAIARRILDALSTPWTLFGGAWAGVVILASLGSWLDAGRPGAASVAIGAAPRPTRIEIVATLRSQRDEAAALASLDNSISGEAEEPPMPPSGPVPGMSRPRTESLPPRRSTDEFTRFEVV
jgi:hypothetical protein